MIFLQVGKLRPGEVLDSKVRFVAQATKVACRLLAGLTMVPLDSDLAQPKHNCNPFARTRKHAHNE